jgi:hypothetical protein
MTSESAIGTVSMRLSKEKQIQKHMYVHLRLNGVEITANANLRNARVKEDGLW